MSLITGTPRAEQDDAQRASSRIPELLCSAALVVVGIPGVPVPIPEAGALGLIAIAVLRRPDLERRRPLWFPGLVLLLLAWLTTSALLNDVQPARRLGHLAIYTVLALVLSSGRLDRLSVLRGLGLGLVVTAASGVANLVTPFITDGYPGRLTGLLSDPNNAGFFLTVYGALALSVLRPGARRTLALLALIVVVVLTFSRTSILAMTFGLLWVALRRRVHPGGAALVLGAAAWSLSTRVEQLKLIGPFESRLGSDQLRERIVAAEEAQVGVRPWVGTGPGTAHVSVQGETFFYHSSYLGLRAEGGWVALAILVVLVALVAWRLMRLPEGERSVWTEVALLATVICAINLGEVLLDLPAAVALGIGMRHVLAPRELDYVLAPRRDERHG